MIPGEIIVQDGDIILNKGARAITLPRSVGGSRSLNEDSCASLNRPLWRRLNRKVCRSVEGGVAISLIQAGAEAVASCRLI